MIEKVEFSKETYSLVRDFHCGDSDYAVFSRDWILGIPPDPCAYTSIKRFKTKVWIYTHLDLVVGVGALGPNKHRDEKISHIPMLAVATEFQGKKIGEKKASHLILEDLIDTASETGHPRVCLVVGEHNTPAIKLYEKFDFKSYYEVDKYGNIRMCKQLGVEAIIA